MQNTFQPQALSAIHQDQGMLSLGGQKPTFSIKTIASTQPQSKKHVTPISSFKKVAERISPRTELHKKLNVLPTSEDKLIPITWLSGGQKKLGKAQQIIYIDTFNLSHSAGEYILAQAGNCDVYIGCLTDQYKIVRKLNLDSPVIKALYLSSCQMKEDQDKLLLGCGDKIFILNQCTLILNSTSDFNLESKHVINFNGSGMLESLHIIRDFAKQNRFYVVLDGNKIKRYEAVDKSQKGQACVVEDEQKIVRGSKIKVVQRIEMKGKEICLLVYMEGMHMPCILSSDEVEKWFPFRLEELVTQYNNILQRSSSDSAQQSILSPCEQSIMNISKVEYSSFSSSLIVSCNDGVLHFCSVVDKQDEFKTSPVWPFRFMIQRSFALQEGNRLQSFSIKSDDSYVCVASNKKVLFYDYTKRVKFSETLKQKQGSPINFVKWTRCQNLLICSLTESRSKVYLYSKLLPIRQINKGRASSLWDD